MSNLVLNGSFETGDFTNWSGSGTTNEIVTTGIDSINGLNFDSIGNTGSNAFLTQTINTSCFNYRLSYYVKNEGGEPTQYFAVSLDGGVTVIPGRVISLPAGPDTLPFMDWTLFTFSFKATGPINLTFITRHDSNYFWLTAISLVQITAAYINKCSLFSDNSMVYYKAGSLAAGGGGSGVRNSRHIRKRT